MQLTGARSPASHMIQLAVKIDLCTERKSKFLVPLDVAQNPQKIEKEFDVSGKSSSSLVIPCSQNAQISNLRIRWKCMWFWNTKILGSRNTLVFQSITTLLFFLKKNAMSFLFFQIYKSIKGLMKRLKNVYI